MLDPDIAKVTLAALGGWTAALTHVDLVLRILVSFLTILYIGAKLYRLYRPRK